MMNSESESNSALLCQDSHLITERLLTPIAIGQRHPVQSQRKKRMFFSPNSQQTSRVICGPLRNLQALGNEEGNQNGNVAALKLHLNL